MPAESVESTLLSFDTLVHFGDPEARPAAAGFLRDAADQCADPSRKQRLMRAADALIAGEPLALTPEGLTWQQAAAAQTVGVDELVEPPEPVYPPEEPEAQEEEEDDEDASAELDELAVIEDRLEEDEDDE